MKSTREILEMLVRELIKRLDGIKSINPTSIYHNGILGDTSFLLAGLLGLLLKQNYREWDERRWIDDSLITNVGMQNNKLIMEGVMIWGKMDTTDQWIAPFSFEIELLKDETSFKEFTFWFCDLDNAEIAYEDFRDNLDYCARTDRKWKYIISSNEALR